MYAGQTVRSAIGAAGQAASGFANVLAYVGANGDFDGTWRGAAMKSLALRRLAHLLIALALAAGAAGAVQAAARTYAPAAADPAVSSAPQTRLADLLRPDGTLDLAAGFRGSVDARGYRLISGSGEAPRFAPAPADAANAPWPPKPWATLGTRIGPADSVNQVQAVASRLWRRMATTICTPGAGSLPPVELRPTTSPCGMARLRPGAPWGAD